MRIHAGAGLLDQKRVNRLREQFVAVLRRLLGNDRILVICHMLPEHARDDVAVHVAQVHGIVVGQRPFCHAMSQEHEVALLYVATVGGDVQVAEELLVAIALRVGEQMEVLDDRVFELAAVRSPEQVQEDGRVGEGIPVESIVVSDQTHTTNIRRVTRADCGNGVTRSRSFHEIDGMITDEPGVTLSTFYADCVPLYFVDPVHKAIGLSHSGWRGTVHKMGKVTVQAMEKAFRTNPEDLVTAIGPSICQDCYEVSKEVIDEFEASFDESLYPKLFYKKENGKYQLNLWEANRQILLEAGVGKHHIQTSNLCTCCNSKFLFSHRASQGKRGNLGAFLMIKN